MMKVNGWVEDGRKGQMTRVNGWVEGENEGRARWRG